jgi:hypothetical protein
MFLVMRVCDSSRLRAFPRIKATAGRDFKWAAQLVDLIAAMDVTPREFVLASRYFESVVFGADRQGYGQTWPNFCANFEKIVAEIRRGTGVTRQEMIYREQELRRQERQRREEVDFARARQERASPEAAAEAVRRFREEVGA